MLKKFALAVVGLSLVSACGGGGGSADSGVPAAYSGSTSRATVTAANAKALSIDIYTGGQLSSALSAVGKEVAAGAPGSFRLHGVSASLERSLQTAVEKSLVTTAKTVAATAQDTVYGASGSYGYSISVDQSSGAFSGSLVFSQYKELSDSPVISGTVGFSGVYNQTTGSFTTIKMIMENMHLASGNLSYTLVGTLSFSMPTTTSGTTVTLSAVLVDNASHRSFWFKDMVTTRNGTSETVRGTFYDPTHGYVVISTITPLTVATTDADPTAGQLLFTGNNGTKARLTFTSGGHVVEVDADGSNTFAVVP